MPAAVIGPTATATMHTPSVLEEQRNIHRDKAHALLRLTEAVEDSNQRRRRANAAASKATAEDLGLLAHDLQSQVAGLNNTPKPPPATAPQTVEAVEADIQNIVGALYQLRENAHLQYQILEMKYFELKRHAFDMEHQNRKLQLQLSDNPAHHHNSTNNNMQVSEEALEAQQSAQQEELMAQLQQENYDLRKQLRESCTECRKMVQENYGLRKILLDNGVHWNRSAEQAGETKEEEEDQSDRMDEFEDAQEDFEDAQESFDAIPEETPTDLLAEDVLTEDVSEIILDTSCDHGNILHNKPSSRVPEEKPRAPVVTDDEGATEDTMSNEESSAEEEEEKKEELCLPLNDTSLSHQELTTPPPKPAISPSYGSLCRTDSTDDSVTTAGTLPGTRRKRSSRKSATFAAMANRLAQANNSYQGGMDSDSISTINTINVLRESYDQLQHERNLELLGMGNVFSATPTKPKGTLQDKTNNLNDSNSSLHSDRASGSPKEAAPPLRRVAYPAQGTGSSGTHKRLSDFLGGGSERSTRSNRSHTIKPTTQAMSARELMRKQKIGKNAINAKELMRKQGGSSSSSSTFHIMMSSVAPPKSKPQVQVSDPEMEEAARISSLLGGFRSSSSAKPSSSSSAAQVSRKAGSDDGKGVSTGSSSQRRPSFFRRKKSHRDSNDDDESVASSKSLGFIFRKSPSKRKVQG